MKAQTMEIIELLKDYLKTKDGNHWIRRFFRCYIDGSYKGEAHYKRNIEFLEENKNKPKKLRAFVISEFLSFMQIEFTEISRSTIQKAIIKTIPSIELETLNQELIEDSLSLIEG